jgi:hypothetical protein
MRKLARIALILGLAGLAVPAGATAGSVIPDPSVLQPPPPPGAICRDDGTYTICQTTLNFTSLNDPIFDLPCGTLYETSTDDRQGIRWYVDGLLVKRRVVAHLRGTWSLSPTGDRPTLSIAGDWNWWIRLTVPGDESSGELTSHGSDFRLTGGGLDIRDAGITYPDGTHHGVSASGFFDGTPQAVAAVCSALQP